MATGTVLILLNSVDPRVKRGIGMANTTKPTDLTVFDLLEALTGELPCYASPNWKVSDMKEEQPMHSLSSAEDQVEKVFGWSLERLA
jgi:hypothetical protein